MTQRNRFARTASALALAAVVAAAQDSLVRPATAAESEVHERLAKSWAEFARLAVAEGALDEARSATIEASRYRLSTAERDALRAATSRATSRPTAPTLRNRRTELARRTAAELDALVASADRDGRFVAGDLLAVHAVRLARESTRVAALRRRIEGFVKDRTANDSQRLSALLRDLGELDREGVAAGRYRAVDAVASELGHLSVRAPGHALEAEVLLPRGFAAAKRPRERLVFVVQATRSAGPDEGVTDGIAAAVRAVSGDNEGRPFVYAFPRTTSRGDASRDAGLGRFDSADARELALGDDAAARFRFDVAGIAALLRALPERFGLPAGAFVAAYEDAAPIAVFAAAEAGPATAGAWFALPYAREPFAPGAPAPPVGDGFPVRFVSYRDLGTSARRSTDAVGDDLLRRLGAAGHRRLQRTEASGASVVSYWEALDWFAETAAAGPAPRK